MPETIRKEIVLDAKNIAYTLRVHTRARRMRLVVHGDGSLVVTTPYRMSEYTIEDFIRRSSRWIIEKIDSIKNLSPLLTLRSSKEDFEANKQSAHIFAQERVTHFNSLYNFTYGKINIKNQKTRWGSCSQKGNLNFNYKILLLPKRCADYIIVHELCHLGEMNHSSKFWTLVERAIPDYRELRANIQKYTIT